MVESIKNISSRLDLHVKKDRATTGISTGIDKTGSSLRTGGIDTVEVGGGNNVSAVLDLAKAPDIDSDAVSRIKDAISKGNYPVDIDRVTDALMDAYMELKS